MPNTPCAVRCGWTTPIGAANGSAAKPAGAPNTRSLLSRRFSLNAEGGPLYTQRIPVPGLTRNALTDWAKAALAPGCSVISDGLACCAGVTAAGCDHQAMIIGPRKPNPVPEFAGLNTILGHLKTSFSGTYHAFHFAQYGSRYLAAFAYRFNRLTGAFTSTPCLPDCSSPPRPSDHDLPGGFARLKHLVNQVENCIHFPIAQRVTLGIRQMIEGVERIVRNRQAVR